MSFLARSFGLTSLTAVLAGAAPVMERLDRGVVAVHEPDGKVFVSWRLLASDPADTAFNVYRTTAPGPVRGGRPGGGGPAREPEPTTVKLNDAPRSGPTWLVDARASLERGRIISCARLSEEIGRASCRERV